MDRLTPKQARQALADEEAVLIDVREPSERKRARLPGSLDVPLGQLPDRLDAIPRDRRLVLMCHHGIRSAMAADFLERNGFTGVSNLEGGIDAWAREIDDSVPRY